MPSWGSKVAVKPPYIASFTWLIINLLLQIIQRQHRAENLIPGLQGMFTTLYTINIRLLCVFLFPFL